jgi:tetratricopeptide (TPR) repeat protein/tRNA A-37 threonylcarbamoyl transferase component Bud32
MGDQFQDQLQSTLGPAYSIERELGGGGMSRVFVATETALGRKVVIKVLPSELAEAISIERFKREIGLAARLQHPHIVPVHAAGVVAGLPYYTMPFVDGESLRARLRKGIHLTLTEVVSVLRDVAKALAYAHGNGVVHRDIKPDNVLLSSGSAMVTDFGVGKALTASKSSADETLTRGGIALGTPEYMAPEQAAADPASDHRVDLYAFGVMAYEMLAGRPPFHGRTPQQLLAAQMVERPQPIENVRPGVPSPLAQLVMKCLEKEPALRPQSATDLVNELDIISGGTSPFSGDVFVANRRTIPAALGLYVIAFVLVAVVARAAMIGLGLPDWVFPGAITVMALGFPVMLFTALVHHGNNQWLGEKTKPWVSWKRTAIGGVLALVSFVLLVSAFVFMRANGIGPVGSLIAAGTISESDKLLVTDFRGGGADSSLSGIVAEAIRTDLSQSSVVSIVPPSSIAGALVRMRRDRTSPVDLTLAREIAAREGIKGIVDGSVIPFAGGYIVSVRLVAASTGDDLASFRETISGPSDLIRTLDKLSGKLRAKIGESLKTVRANPPLEQVTTSSINALRKYAAGMRAFGVEGDLPKSAALFREAVAIDTTFAAAYRALGSILLNLGMAKSSIDSALELAYRYRDRLTDAERYATIGTYFSNRRDRKRSADAYEALLDIDSLNITALNNLGRILIDRRELARAEQLFRRPVRTGTATAPTYVNLFHVLVREGKVAAAESTEVIAKRAFPAYPVLSFMKVGLFNARRQLDSVKSSADKIRSTEADASLTSIATWFARDVELMRGHINEAERLTHEGYGIDEARGAPVPPLTRAVESAWMDIWHREMTARGLEKLETALTRMPLRSLRAENRRYGCSIVLVGFLKPCFDLATVYALAGRPDRARALIAEDAVNIKDTAVRRQRAPLDHAALAEVALAEKRPQDAITEFKLSDRLPDGPANECLQCFLGELARAYDAAGARDSTIATMERYLATPPAATWPDDLYLARFHRRLGELYDLKGDSAKATAHYEQFAELWKTADPELQPKVAIVRERLRVLRKK